LGYDVTDSSAWNFPSAFSSQKFDCVLISDDVPEAQAQAIAPVVRSVQPKALLVRLSYKPWHTSANDRIVQVEGRSALTSILESLIHRALLEVRLAEIKSALADPSLDQDTRKMMVTLREELERSLGYQSNDDSAVA
jgi:hypothetical protein